MCAGNVYVQQAMQQLPCPRLDKRRSASCDPLRKLLLRNPLYITASGSCDQEPFPSVQKATPAEVVHDLTRLGKGPVTSHKPGRGSKTFSNLPKLAALASKPGFHFSEKSFHRGPGLTLQSTQSGLVLDSDNSLTLREPSDLAKSKFWPLKISKSSSGDCGHM